MLNPDRWLERAADRYESAETEDERREAWEQYLQDCDRRCDEMRYREAEQKGADR